MEKLTKENGLVLANYKEPLKHVEKPYFGYQGAVLVTADGSKMQCHVCGDLFSNVAAHAYLAHGMKAKVYKKTFGIMEGTSLVSEQERERMKVNSMKIFNSLSPQEKERRRKQFMEWSKKGKKGGKKGKKHALESNNTKGTCPDQIADQIKKCATDIGHSPSENDFVKWAGSQRFVGLAHYRFGSWKKAIKYAGFKLKKKIPAKTLTYRTRDELLDILLIFWKETGKIPTDTDCKRGLLPAGHIFRSRFGSFPKARSLAGITETVARGRSNKTPFGDLQKTGYKTNSKKKIFV